jgi:hypothetical protein
MHPFHATVLYDDTVLDGAAFAQPQKRKRAFRTSWSIGRWYVAGNRCAAGFLFLADLLDRSGGVRRIGFPQAQAVFRTIRHPNILVDRRAGTDSASPYLNRIPMAIRIPYISIRVSFSRNVSEGLKERIFVAVLLKMAVFFNGELPKQ